MYEDQIAIIGAACRLPGAQNLSEFWTLLSSGRDAVTEIPDSRWTKDFYFHPNPAERGKAYTWAAGVIDKVGGRPESPDGEMPGDRPGIEPQRARTVGRMHEKLGAACTADVIGVRVSDREASDLGRRSTQGHDRRVQPRQRSAHARVDDGDVVLEDRVRRRADEADRVDRWSRDQNSMRVAMS